MRRLRINANSPGRGAVLRFALLACLGLAASVGWAQPANDDFANAFVISGSNGTTNGDNISATLENNEPEIFPGDSADETVWYAWTAPANGAYTFSITSSDFDALFAVYTGNSVDALTEVNFGYNIISFGGFNLPITFTAAAGTTYYIQVDGWPDGGYPEGNFVLTWSALTGISAAGDFSFAQSATACGSSLPLYIASERESQPPADPRGEMHATAGARLTVTRLKGFTGRVLVDYTVTNTFYTNLFTTNIYGTNICLTNLYYQLVTLTNITYTTNPGPPITITTNYTPFQSNIVSLVTYTNYFTTNIVVTARYQNNEYGCFNYLPDRYTVTNIIGTNGTGLIAGSTTNFYSTNGAPVFACFNEFPCRRRYQRSPHLYQHLLHQCFLHHD
jgi:hypothetical protein